MVCRNCQAELGEHDKYCWNCGQENTDGRVTLLSFLQEILSSILNIDAKAYRTIRDLFIPGELTIAYFKGYRKRYFTPLRIFLFMGVIHFALLSWLLSSNINLNFNENDEEWNFEEKVVRNYFFLELDTARKKITERLPASSNAALVFDSLYKELAYEEQDSIHFSTSYIDRNLRPAEKRLDMAYADFKGKEIEQIAIEQGLDHWMEQKQFVQAFRLINDTSSLFRFILGKLVWMALIMMPAVAIILKLMYVRRKRFYVEHLFFAFHYHAFAFLIFSLLMVWPNWHWQGALVALGITLLYQYVAMVRYYKQGWFKTFIKFNILNWIYLFLFTTFISLMFVVSIFLF